MEKYCQIAYEAYRQDTPTGYLDYAGFKKALCKCLPWWAYSAGGAVVGYYLKK
jgi:hypothetical protein